MAKETVLVISGNEEYVTGIESRLAFAFRDDVTLQIITDKNYLLEYLKTPHSISFCIVDEMLLSYVAEYFPESKRLLISEENGADRVSRYEGARAILQRIDAHLLKEEMAVRKKATHVVYVSSVGGGCGKTLMSLGLAARLAETGQRTLYINAESLQDFGYYLDDPAAMSGKMSVLLSADPGTAAEEILVSAGKQGFDYLPPSGHLLTSSEITLEKILDFVTSLVRRDDYDDIVVELPGNAGEDEIACMNSAEYLVLVSDQTEYSARRLSRLNENLRDFHGDGYIVCSKAEPEKENHLMEQDFSVRFPICECVEQKNEPLTLKDILEGEILKRTAQAVI
ncbi:AAA domain-containing protein [Lachnospiraceae bacterium]|nr:AAA domain-containing protein [Lachnospiraceae bacterium]